MKACFKTPIAAIGLPLLAMLFAMTCASASDGPKQNDKNPHSKTTKQVTDKKAAQKWVSGYYVGYQTKLYPPEKIDFSAITHLIVGRVTPNKDGTLKTTFDIDAVKGPAMARDLAKRTYAAGKIPILMVGGAGERGWSRAASDANRATFVTNLIRVMNDLGFSGLDLDWEPISNEDKPKLKALAEDLRAVAPKIVLTLPVGWLGSNVHQADTYFRDIAPLFDQINIMTYSMAGSWTGWKSWHSSALKGESATTPSSIQSNVRAYVNAGIPASKLGIGIAFYGCCWNGASGPRQDVGKQIASDNAMSYTNIMKHYFNKTNRHWDSEASTPYLSFKSPTGPKGCTFISYDDPESIAKKGEYIHDMGLGGAIIWTINQGYIASNPVGSRNPPLDAAKQSILLLDTGAPGEPH
ncbi:MAG: glycoside hydrolase family 18 protein [Proteobacteria bacterium]|nr:glycoside hydrolase family 18 protein [Pseudomonadota bacterium]